MKIFLFILFGIIGALVGYFFVNPTIAKEVWEHVELSVFVLLSTLSLCWTFILIMIVSPAFIIGGMLLYAAFFL